MHILIEDYNYPLTSSSYFSSKAFSDELDGEFYCCKKTRTGNSQETVSFNCVGYYFSKSLHDCVIILPKVLIVNDKDAGKQKLLLGTGDLTPEMIFDLDNLDASGNVLIGKQSQNMAIRQELRVFGVWVYQALKNYYNDNPDNSILSKTTTTPTHNDSQKRQLGSLLEVILELLKFNRDNQPFFSRIMANSRSGSRIKWNKTIGKTTPILQNGMPYYTHPVKQKALPNYEEELVIIYYSILQYITIEFGFHYSKIYEIPLIPDNIFKTYIKGRGMMRLKQIKNNYFSKDALHLWELCMAFFNELYSLYSTPSAQQHLLAKSFHQVFEDMIDFLIGDKVKKGFKSFKDRKQIDHIYRYTSLIGCNENYYIGDSKYYPLKLENGRMSVDLPQDSIHKQYIYALNVQQQLMENFREGKYSGELFDVETESFNFIPNFFISGSLINSSVDDDAEFKFNYNDNGIEIANKIDVRKHFNDRLFDRSTLKLFYFNVNFMYVLKAYALRYKTWRVIARAAIKNGIQSKLFGDDGLYKLFKLEGDVERIGEMQWSDYKTVAGKIIKISDTFYMALQNPFAETLINVESLMKRFNVILISAYPK